MNVCPSGSAAGVCFTHTVTHTHSQAFCLSGVSGYPLLSLGLTHTVCGVEKRSVWLEVQLVKECLLSACEGWGRAKVPPPTPLSYISFFLPSFSLSHLRTLLSRFSGSKRDVCAGAWQCAVSCEWGCPLTEQKFITGGNWLKTIQSNLKSISWIPAFKYISRQTFWSSAALMHI